MSNPDQHPITHWLAHLKAGNIEAAQPLWECYFERLVRLARARFRAGGDADEEDIALSAFKSFCLGAAGGRFPRLSDRHDLWRLLVFITAQKICDRLKVGAAQKRGGRSRHEDGLSLDEVVGADPTPEFAAMMAEQVQRLLSSLDDDVLCAIAVWKMEGFTNEEIAGRLGCALKTVSNKLRLIRLKWEREAPMMPVAATTDGTLTLTGFEHVVGACDRFESAWRADRAPRIEEYLDLPAAVDRWMLLRELVALEAELRKARGDTIAASDYGDRFPEYATRIGSMFEGLTTAAGPGSYAPPGLMAAAGLLVNQRYEILEMLGRGGMGIVWTRSSRPATG